MAIKFVDNLDLAGNKITGLGVPIDDTDAAAKKWVVDTISAAITDAGGLDPEAVQDIVGAMFPGSATLSWAYDDAAGNITGTVTDSPTVGGATAAQLRDRSTHTGSQLAATISDFATAVVAAVNAGVIDADTLNGQSAAALQTAITASIVDSAPTTLDTLNELATALGNDPNFATTVTNALSKRVQTYATLVGDGAATSYAVTHNLGTRDVIVQVYDAATYDEVGVGVVRTSTTAVTVSFATAPAANAYRVVVQGRAD